MAIRSILAMLTAVCMPVTAAHAERRALVIGNAEYKSGNLEQPKRDARDVARALAALGFRVDVELNLRSTPMEKAVARFSRGRRVGPSSASTTSSIVSRPGDRARR